MKTFEDIVAFHGHACPGLALGYRVSLLAMKELGERATDEELVAIVENDSCAVDAVQVVTGCTFGKGNLIFRDYGKQVYTFIKRPKGRGIRISIDFSMPEETDEEKRMWERYNKGDRSGKVINAVHARKTKKIDMILHAKDEDLFQISRDTMTLPDEAGIYTSLRCSLCTEKVMETRARVRDGQIVCIPCFERSGSNVQHIRQKRRRKKQ
ncbi:MAG: FmdE family protein [Thermodesulfovibrionales bacterium]|nr:FmdE family protein [Thermodesulfovibrionales bacterium]